MTPKTKDIKILLLLFLSSSAFSNPCPQELADKKKLEEAKLACPLTITQQEMFDNGSDFHASGKYSVDQNSKQTIKNLLEASKLQQTGQAFDIFTHFVLIDETLLPTQLLKTNPLPPDPHKLASKPLRLFSSPELADFSKVRCTYRIAKAHVSTTRYCISVDRKIN